MKRVRLISLLFLLMLGNQCTDLEEKYEGNLTSSQVATADTDALLNNLDNSLRAAFQNFGDVVALSELTTDEMIGPTRGMDWSDNGIWRSLHAHTWSPDHPQLADCFNNLNGVVFAATDFLKFSKTPDQAARARFYRAWAMYWVLDFFDQVPYREPGESTVQHANVRSGMKALEYIINELNEIMPDLPDGPASEPNKNAAKGILMKCYLNKGVYANRLSPGFDPADMNNVISLADEIINSNLFTFSDNYFDNFAPDNTNIGKENIFTQLNIGGQPTNSGLFLIMAIPLHYVTTNAPFGVNGWTTLSDAYDKFEVNDLRRGQAYPTGGPPNPGNRVNMGFLVDQQYNLFTDEPMYDNSGNAISYTREVKLTENGATLQVSGIRPLKYAWDWQNFGAMDNDWVYLRLPDVLLMKAEAILRGGTPTSAGPYGNTALQLVNSIRQHPSRNASALTSVDLDTLLDERFRELWFECWRRQDLIRFGKFLGTFQEKEYVSNSKYILFAIPNQQIAVNPNLKQNPGY